MLTKLVRATLALSLAARCLGQDRFVSEIPATEESALAGIVEDDPADEPQFRSSGDEDDESPAYTLYQKALPIPPVATPKQ
jgi:bilirubin oxidase